jgi:type II secretory pathway component GspD/PulD (secretin)
VSPPAFQPQAGVTQPQVVIQDQRPPPTPAQPTRPGAAAEAGTGIVRNIQVVADKDNNTLLLVATPPEYAVIETAIKKMDVPARQVMIEVTMANVTLDDTLEFGVEWLFKGGAPSGRGTGGLFTRSGPFNPARRQAAVQAAQEQAIPRCRSRRGFVYIINNANFPGGIQAVLHLLDTTATRRSSPIRIWARSTTRKRRSRPATEFRCASRPTSAAR